MKWRLYPLPVDDKRAAEQIALSLRCGDRTLGKKLLAKYSATSGNLFVIAMEDLDVDILPDFHYATYQSGKLWAEMAGGTTTIPVGQGPIDGLILFLQDYLRRDAQRVVVISNWIRKRTDPNMSPEARKLPEVRATCLCTSRLAFFGDEVYHVLTPADTDPELIEDTIREPWHQYFTGVCAAKMAVPDNNELSAVFLDELVDGTEHVFVPGFDGDGFLVWSPQQPPTSLPARSPG